MDDPGRLLGERARALLTSDPALRAELRETIDAVIPTLWQSVEAIEWSDDESLFEELDPPSEWRVPDVAIESEHPGPASGLIWS